MAVLTAFAFAVIVPVPEPSSFRAGRRVPQPGIRGPGGMERTGAQEGPRRSLVFHTGLQLVGRVVEFKSLAEHK